MIAETNEDSKGKLRKHPTIARNSQICCAPIEMIPNDCQWPSGHAVCKVMARQGVIKKKTVFSTPWCDPLTHSLPVWHYFGGRVAFDLKNDMYMQMESRTKKSRFASDSFRICRNAATTTQGSRRRTMESSNHSKII